MSTPNAGVPRPNRKPHAKTLARMDALADMMAEGCPSISEAARRLGEPQNVVDKAWQFIRRGLGPQAV